MIMFFAVSLYNESVVISNLQCFYKIHVKYKVSQIKYILWHDNHMWYLKGSSDAHFPQVDMIL